MKTPHRALTLTALTLSALAWTTGCATHAINGQITTRNGDPLERAIVSLDPGGVELITDQDGAFMIDYLRDTETGERVKLDKRTEYQIEIFKVGYHTTTSSLYFKRGELYLDPIVLKEETVRVVGSDADIDPGVNFNTSESGGGSYEGE